ncbi:LysR family transcriptional regulator [Frigidibacter albus]|uniref:LysR family transcriptional regulator n=1 Tax=Frigidibacter albus TaxID=1465486 RepID=A0A6L8VHV3_9RHOB|nr:LysR substrate-binding domain-containing protein [Frigidibacter albus]MZQ89301.1 LysR family transcriptional regulator [Frigidibacter albus]NBE31207.1 LysR family transcriptional regulator [Frigidibacter albus]GGH53485.1 LysR family transcriptional regulator [Frigidibacter albus]
MELSQLRTLIHVAELGSLSKAADRLHTAQPALSRQIRLLEEELGVRLFDRHGRGMIMTDQGQDVLRHALRVMGELEEIRATVSDEDAPLRGHVSIGMPPTASDILAEPLVSAFQTTHPEATLRIVSAYSGYLTDWLHRNEVDAAILYDPKSARTLRINPLLEETLFLIGPRESGFTPDTPVDFEELENQRLLLPSSGHGLRAILERCAAERDIVLNVKVEADSYSTLKALVRSGHGVTVLPLAPIHRDLAEGRLCAAPLINPVPMRRLVLSYPTDRPTPRLARFAGQIIATNVARMVDQGIWAGRIPDPPPEPRGRRWP